MSPAERRIVAYHELGHAVVASLLPGADPVQKVSVVPRESARSGSLCRRHRGPLPDDRDGRCATRSPRCSAAAPPRCCFAGRPRRAPRTTWPGPPRSPATLVRRYGMSQLGLRTFERPRWPWSSGPADGRTARAWRPDCRQHRSRRSTENRGGAPSSPPSCSASAGPSWRARRAAARGAAAQRAGAAPGASTFRSGRSRPRSTSRQRRSPTATPSLRCKPAPPLPCSRRRPSASLPLGRQCPSAGLLDAAKHDRTAPYPPAAARLRAVLKSPRRCAPAELRAARTSRRLG